jgi:hypothetical protein
LDGRNFSSVDEEWSDFLTNYSQVTADDGAIMTYWKNARQVWPMVARLGAIIAALPVSGAAIESSFSITGLIATARRSRLTPGHLETLALLAHHPELAEKYLYSLVDLWLGAGRAAVMSAFAIAEQEETTHIQAALTATFDDVDFEESDED